ENTGAAAITLSVNLNSLTQGFGGVIRDGTGGGALSLVKAGTGTLVLTGANAYTGPTTAQAGVVQFNSAASVGGSGASVAVLFGATAAAGYAMDQAFLNRIAPSAAGVIALAANSGNNLSFAALATTARPGP